MAPSTNRTTDIIFFSLASIGTASLAVACAYGIFHRRKGSEEDKSFSVEKFIDREDRRIGKISKGAEAANPASVQNFSGNSSSQIPFPSDAADQAPRILSQGAITIAYCSTTGTCANFAKILYRVISDRLAQVSSKHAPLDRRVQLIRVSEVDWWDELVNNEDEINLLNASSSRPKKKPSSPILLFVLPTWTGGTLPPDSKSLIQSLAEISADWRIAPEPLRSSNPATQLRVAAFGMGSSAYDSNTMGKPAKDVFSYLVGKLGARPLLTENRRIRSKNKVTQAGRIRGNSLVIGDSEVGDATIIFKKWMHGVVDAIFHATSTIKTINKKSERSEVMNLQEEMLPEEDNSNEQKASHDCGHKGTDSGHCSNLHQNSDEEDDSFSGSFSDDDDDYDNAKSDVMDVEDMGDAMKSEISSTLTEPKEMVTPNQARALKKEGYRLIGTHSAVKLCRWTKHQLRGRGGCYKHTHYGITSYQCMEATPSLACANKCVFCWRHHKNPVGKEWRWKTDDPEMIVEEAVQTHISMIKETKGIPGVQADRWEEAHNVRHCALSLVGEPIMYPRINELLRELHRREISTFLVTNGQHPEAIRNLVPITQLYVSVDAPTPESLEAIDRPLFGDAWERLKESLSCLKNKGQRTVARLTVVKGWNSGEIGGYARLIALGHCSLVEVKGVTFCGKSDASNLNMTNTPWHHEVVDFAKTLLNELRAIRRKGDVTLPEYDLACEHKHSCSVLLARVDQFTVLDSDNQSSRKWRTWIDYDKFQLLAAKNALDPKFKFGVKDYVADTPSWAYFGADEEGFDPSDVRHRKKKKHPKYSKFDEAGVPTHDEFNKPLSQNEMNRLRNLMEEKKKELGEVSMVTELKGGEKKIDDPRLMFRGLVVKI